MLDKNHRDVSTCSTAARPASSCSSSSSSISTCILSNLETDLCCCCFCLTRVTLNSGRYGLVNTVKIKDVMECMSSHIQSRHEELGHLECSVGEKFVVSVDGKIFELCSSLEEAVRKSSEVSHGRAEITFLSHCHTGQHEIYSFDNGNNICQDCIRIIKTDMQLSVPIGCNILLLILLLLLIACIAGLLAIFYGPIKW